MAEVEAAPGRRAHRAVASDEQALGHDGHHDGERRVREGEQARDERRREDGARQAEGVEEKGHDPVRDAVEQEAPDPDAREDPQGLRDRHEHRVSAAGRRGAADPAWLGAAAAAREASAAAVRAW